MHPYKIVSDSSCDLPELYIKELDIALVPFYVSFDTVTYCKEIIDIKPHEFYERMVKDRLYPKTSLPSIQDYIDVFEPHLKSGSDVVCLCLSKKFSGSYQSALNAKNILVESYPNRKIEVVDTTQATGGQGLIVYEAARMRNASYSIDKLIETIEMLKDTAKINFTIDSLEYLQKGGRIGKASALAGAILNIKPIIVLENGELMPVNKVRGRKKALNTVIDMTLKEIGDKKHEYLFCLVNSYRVEDIEYIKDILEKEGISILMPVFDIGVTIGTHTGETAVGICYIKKFELL